MTSQSHSVSVKQFPEKLGLKQRRIFMRELKNCLNAGSPRIVIDCSRLQNMDRGTFFLLLCCLEEAMKCHGDVRLATMSRQDHSLFMAANMDRLFKIFDHVADAVNSYGRVNVLTLEPPLSGAQPISVHAA